MIIFHLYWSDCKQLILQAFQSEWQLRPACQHFQLLAAEREQGGISRPIRACQLQQRIDIQSANRGRDWRRRVIVDDVLSLYSTPGSTLHQIAK